MTKDVKKESPKAPEGYNHQQQRDNYGRHRAEHRAKYAESLQWEKDNPRK